MAVLPQYLAEQTEEAIRRRMLEHLPPDLDKSEGGYIWDALSPTAIELSQAAIWAQEVLRRGFAGTAFGPYLDLRCEERGIFRRPEEKASGQVIFTGKAGTEVPAGVRVATPADPMLHTSSVEFVTTESAVLDESGKGTAAVEAVEAGILGNVAAGAIQLMVSPVPGIAKVTNPEATRGGTNIESDESLLQRYLMKVRSPGTSGNKADYFHWAMEVPGVGGALVIPAANGPGTVKVIIVNAEKQPASGELVQETADYIESRRPIGAAVTLVSASGKTVDVTADVVLADGYTLPGVQLAFAEALKEHLKEVALANTYVSYAKVGTILLSIPGVLDGSNILVNGAAANVPLDHEQIPVLGVVSLGV